MLLLLMALCLSCVIVIPESRSHRLLVEMPEELLRRAQGEVKTIGMALETYFVDYSVYPKVECLKPKYGIPGLCPVDALRAVIKPYISILPTWAPWGGQYYLWISKDAQRYAVICMGADLRIDDCDTFQELLTTLESPDQPLSPKGNLCTTDEIVLANGQFLRWATNQTRECR